MSGNHSESCPLLRTRVIDQYFMEHRAKLLDVAAFLDRVDRAREDGSREDFRVRAIREAAAILLDYQTDRARRILELWSDHSVAPLESAAGMKGAYGTYPGPPVEG